MSTNDELTTPEGAQSGTTRRTVVRGAATAAWAVPAVTLISAAPAVAASGPASLTVGTFNSQRVNLVVDLAGNTLSAATITNLNTQPTTAFTVIVEFEPTNANSDFSGSTLNTAPTGFGAPTVTTYNTRSRRFTFVSTAQLSGSGTPANASRSFSMNINLAPTGGPGTMRITANPGAPGTLGANNPRSDTF